MTELTGKQKRFLRSLGQKMPVAMQFGKAGVSPEAIAQLRGLLERCELVKVRLPGDPPPERAEMARQIAAAVGATIAGTVGHTILLYRFNIEAKASARVELPA